jgi:hypothetical protein
MTCPSCGHEVPRTHFCVRCGEPLENAGSPYPHEGRGYAAAPHERWYEPRVVSSLFPHLPRANMAEFRVALVGGTVLIVVLCAFGLFPLALIASAVLVPFLVVLYLLDVDLYEDEPLPMLAFTIGWGLVFGILLGLAAQRLAGSTPTLSGGPSTHDVIWLGVVLPIAAALLAIAGPLVLLPYRRFDDVLDGVTFGGACAVTLLAAEVLTNSADFLHFGLTASGDTSLWVARLLTLGVALPVLGAAVVGIACGSFWLRFRAPESDRRRVGAVGSPLLAVPVAAAALVGSNLILIEEGEWAALALTAGLALAALVLLRLLIHLGLTEEADERPIGPPLRCPNCGRETPSHTFCGSCGIALRALPKDGPRVAGARPAPPRFGRPVRLAGFAAVAAGALGVSVVVIVLLKPGPVRPLCTPGEPCGRPPVSRPVNAPHATTAAAPVRLGTAWTSSLGAGLRYPGYWHVRSADGTHLLLTETLPSGTNVTALVEVVPAGVGVVQELGAQLDAESKGYLGLRRDWSSAHAVLGPEVGFVHGVTAAYTATTDQPPSPSEPVELLFQVATFGGATVLVEAVTDEHEARSQDGANAPFPDFSDVDLLMDTFYWGLGL